MRRLRDILLKVNARQIHLFTGILNILLSVLRIIVRVEWNFTTEAKRQIHLRDLIILRHVGIEIILPIPNHGWRSFTVEQHSRKNGALDRKFVQHRKRPGKPQTGRANITIWLITK